MHLTAKNAKYANGDWEVLGLGSHISRDSRFKNPWLAPPESACRRFGFGHSYWRYCGPAAGQQRAHGGMADTPDLGLNNRQGTMWKPL